MQLPIVAPAPIVSKHAQAFRDLFNDERTFENFQTYLTGLIVLENKSLSNISRCTLQSADKTNLSRFLKESPWSSEAMNQRRVQYMLAQTVEVRLEGKQSCLLLDDTLCEHVGSLFEYIDRHYNHSDGGYPLAHNLVTSHYRSGAVGFPVDCEMYRRYEDLTQWEQFVQKHFPEQEIPRTTQARQTLHKQLDPQLRKDPEFAQLDAQFRTKLTIASQLLEQAIAHRLPFTTVLMDSWYLSSEFVAQLALHQKDWVSLLKRNRKLSLCGFQLRDAQGQPIALPSSEMKVEDFVPLIPPTAYRKLEIEQQSYWCFSFCARLSGLGKVRLVISFQSADLSGTYAVLVTNRLDWTAKQVLAQYLQRWTIETFYRDSKQLLGLDEYRMRSAVALQSHWCLVFVAYSLLHLACLPSSSKPPKGNRPTQPSQTIGQVVRQQGQALIEQLILFAHDLLEQGDTATQVFTRLFAKQHKSVFPA
ncbi:MAG: transposase [Leptolyngbyaceae cyanobacterium SU_3_3]|nr:transposase [Leptolyngbyaceae cyanobacterium SU_3_3]